MKSFLKIVSVSSALTLAAIAAPAASADEVETWTAKAHKEFAASQRYPKSAIDAGAEGTIILDVRVNSMGSIVGFSIKESSGHMELDSLVIDLLARVDPLPKLPDGLHYTNLTVPLTYKLAEDLKVSASVEVAEETMTLQDWANEVKRTLARRQAYPTDLMNEGVEGVVHVEVTIEASGRIAAQRVKTSSGHEALDQEALNLMQNIGSFPALPDGHDGITVTIPLNYNIAG